MRSRSVPIRIYSTRRSHNLLRLVSMASATSVAITVLVVLILAIGVSYFKSSESVSGDAHESIKKVFVPVRKDGVIFISDGAKGSSREAAVELSKHGYHVLVGCKTEAEIRSFAFDSRKGMEMIKFDISSPETYIPLIYRLRQIRRDLDRHIVGVVLNLADYIEDYSGEPSTNYLDIVYLDRHYKALFKNPIRLLQSIFELLKHYDTLESAGALLLGDSATTSAAGKVVDTAGLRITTLYGEYAVPEGVTAGSSEYISLCGTKCDVQASLLNYLTGFSQISEYSNFTLHNVKIPLQAALKPALADGKGALNPPQTAGDLISPRGEKNYENSILAWRMKQIERYTHSHIKWVTSTAGSAGAVEEEEFVPEDSRGGHRAQLSVQVKAILHSFLSPYPLEVYN